MNAHRITRTALILISATLLSIAGLFSVYSAPLMAHLHKQAAATPSAVKTAFVSPVKPHVSIPVKSVGFKVLPHSRRLYTSILKSPKVKSNAVTTAPILIDENVQTFDVFAPGPTFAPASNELPSTGKSPTLALVATNKHGVWSLDQTYFVFSSNRDATGAIATDGKYHIWAIPSVGGTPVQITTGTGNEDFPALNAQNNLLAFTSTYSAASAAGGVANLYTITFNLDFNNPGTAVDVAGLSLPAFLKTPAGTTTVPRDFGNVLRPTWSPASDRLVFAAQTISGATAGHTHLYFLYVNSNGYQPELVSGNPPAKLTDGLADDNDPAWSPDGNYVAFDSTAGTISNNASTIISPTNAPSRTSAPTAGRRRLFVFYDGKIGSFGTGAIAITNSGVDSGEPAWSSSAATNEFINPNTKFAYMAFSRAAVAANIHDIYYFQLIPDLDTPRSITPEDSTANVPVHLNTSEYNDAARTLDTTSYTDAGNVYDDRYPTWSPFTSVFSIAYQSPRTITYIRPQIDTTPVTVALPVEKGISYGRGTGNVGANYLGLLQSEVLNINPPNLLRFNGNEVLHINIGSSPILPSTNNPTGSATRQNIQPGQTISVTVRLSDREAAIDDTQVYLQIKDPDSKYQDQAVGAGHVASEHKVFARDAAFQAFYSSIHPEIVDSGSSTLLEEKVNKGANHFGNSFIINRGAIGGADGGDNISVGRDGYFGEPPTTDPVSGVGSDPAAFIPWGPEYECQVVNPTFASHGTGDTVDGTPGTLAPPTAGVLGDYRAPFYLAGFDDQVPFTGLVQNTNPAFAAFTSHLPRGTTEWLPMTRAAQQDGLGGVLYTVSWKTPTSPSDYYLDVVAYDTAKFPGITTGTRYDNNSENWRIYDNIWGFSTAPFDGSNDILVVSDNALGQKFAATSFGGRSRGNLTNLVPTIFGTESYLTDIDVNQLPNAVHWNPTAASGVKIQLLGYPVGLRAFGLTIPANGLGVGSYSDAVVDDGRLIDELPYPKSQRYSLWRILCRGAVTQDVLSGYLPTKQSQPAVADAVNNTNAPAKSVIVANKCIIWIAPFTGDLLSGPGSLADPTTQTTLKSFEASGGRLCISGQDIASTLTSNGTINNGPNDFLQSVLSAQYVSSRTVDHSLGSNTKRLTSNANIPGFSGGGTGFFALQGNGSYVSFSPSQKPLIIDNADVTSNVPLPSSERGDGSLDQLPRVLLGQALLSSQIDTVSAVNGATVDSGLGGAAGLIYNEYASGGRSVYGSFGLEGLSTDYFETTVANVKYFNPHNQRSGVMHNIVSYLRTGSVTGNVRDVSGGGGGVGVPNATVYVKGGDGGPNNVFSALTNSTGGYSISGLEPGPYTATAYKTGYTTASAGTGFIVEGDTTAISSGISIAPLPAGSISGKVTDSTSGLGISGATVKFVSTDGQVTKTVSTGPDGTYTIGNVPVGTYNGTASDSPLYATSAVQSTVVNSGQNTVSNYALVPAPGSIAGTITSSVDGKPISGATVTATLVGTTTPVQTVTTGADGRYIFTNLNPGKYTITAAASGYAANSIVVTVSPADTLTGKNIALTPIPPGTVGGLVKDSNGLIVSGALITIKNTALKVVATYVTTATTTSPVAPKGDGLPINYTASLAVGTYSVTATKTGLTTVIGTAVIASNAFKRVNLTFIVPPPTGTVGGIVRDSDGAAVSGATVTIKNAAGAVVKTVTTGAISSPTAPIGDGASINYSATLSIGTYTITVTKTGYTTVTGTVGVTANAFKRLNLTFPAIHTFPAGLNFVSTPYDYSGTSIDTLFGALTTNRSHVAIYQPLISTYVLDPTSPADAIHIGLGYWVRLTSAHSVPFMGTVPTSATVAVGLSPGWNMIGVPSTVGISVANLKFANPQDANSPLSFADASGPSYNLVSPTLYGYNQGSNVYQSIGSTSTLQPWQAYWIKAKVSTTVLIPTR